MKLGTKIRIAEEIVIEWLDRPAGAICPNCGRRGEVRQILDIDFRPPDRQHHFILQVCPACDVRFVDNTHSMDYGHEDVIELGWQAYQVQQGAGIWPIVRPMMRIPRGPGARVLEIGGGYGFGLDFCVRARNWRGEGYDPSLLSAFGRDELGLTVHQGYFGQEHLVFGPWDVLVATEVIEHVVIPPEFLRLARAALSDNGFLVLTTPDAEFIVPETSSDRLMPLLSPGVHVVLQTQSSLTFALHAAGFSFARVEREGMSLIAYASASPFTLIEDPVGTRAAYRTYLLERALLSPPSSDLALGFAGRGLFEAANDGDWTASAEAWTVLVPAVQARFGINIDIIDTLPAPAFNTTLAELLDTIPLNLGMVCFARAMDRLAAGESRSSVARLLNIAGQAVAAVQTALSKRSITDALYVVLGPLIEDELLICSAEAGAGVSVAPLAIRGGTLAWRGLIGLVNAGAHAFAEELRTTAGLGWPSEDLPAALQRDAWLSLANLGLFTNPELAIQAGVALGPEGRETLRQAFIRLVNSGAFEAANDLAVAHGLEDTSMDHPDAALAFAMLALNAGDPADVLRLIEKQNILQTKKDELITEVFVRLVNAGRYGEATALASTSNFATCDVGEISEKVWRAEFVLALNTDDPDAALNALRKSRLVADEAAESARQILYRYVNAARFFDASAIANEFSLLPTDEALTRTLVSIALETGQAARVSAIVAASPLASDVAARLCVTAFTQLVSEAAFGEAQRLMTPDFLAVLATESGPEGQSARLASVLLDLGLGNIEAAMQRLMLLREAGVPATTLGPLALEGFVRLVNEGRDNVAAALWTEGAENWLFACSPALREDALVLRVMLMLRLGESPFLALEAANAAGVSPARMEQLAFASLVRLVNSGDYAGARQIFSRAEKGLLRAAPPFDNATADAMFAAGMLFLQEKHDWRRAAAILARLRDGLIRRAPADGPADPLFWPALRAEFIALQNLNRREEGVSLLKSFISIYPHCPEDLMAQMTTTN
jgi:hypothetical protein